jgi:hypothetical protein
MNLFLVCNYAQRVLNLQIHRPFDVDVLPTSILPTMNPMTRIVVKKHLVLPDRLFKNFVTSCADLLHRFTAGSH